MWYDLHYESDARMVEIEVYSAVGTSWMSCRHSAEFRCKVRRKGRWRSAATAEEREKNGVKDVVKILMPGVFRVLPVNCKHGESIL